MSKSTSKKVAAEEVVIEIDHDTLFKELLTTYFAEFIEAFVPKMTGYLERESITPVDKEFLGEVIPPAGSDKREADIVVRAKFKPVLPANTSKRKAQKLAGQESFFLIHLENQAKSQADFSRRMFSYFARLHEKYEYLPIYPIALFSFDEPLRAEPEEYRVAFPDKTVLEFKYTVVQLNRLSWRDFVNQPNPVAAALMAKMKIAPKDRVRVKLECLKILAGLPLDRTRLRFLVGFVETYLRLNEADQTEFRQEFEKAQLVPQKKEEVMQFATYWHVEGIKQGRIEGREEGREEGRQEGKTAGVLEITLRLLRRKFGPENITPELDEQIKLLNLEQLENLGEALLDFTESRQLEEWLNQLKTAVAPQEQSS